MSDCHKAMLTDCHEAVKVCKRRGIANVGRDAGAVEKMTVGELTTRVWKNLRA